MNSMYRIILGSASPRRQQLLEGTDLPFTVEPVNGLDEKHLPPETNPDEIPLLLARSKSLAFPRPLEVDELLITADTLVFSKVLTETRGSNTRWTVLGKPASAREAYLMLERLSGSCHKVITGICLRFGDQKAHPEPIVFSDYSLVWFMPLLQEEISYYVNKYKPYDKAGSYGVQEWIGYIGIERIEGSYFNVMGFPVHLLWKHLKELHVISFS
ncbi:MAG: Septum formation protein Maf [Bacteroidetes bacterium ADurb.Bin013]|nr:MAG: Septum formation protein Maf [Bacteroidetes bacterium ADurb.Bin013]